MRILWSGLSGREAYIGCLQRELPFAPLRATRPLLALGILLDSRSK
jgi:hypothetical protein